MLYFNILYYVSDAIAQESSCRPLASTAWRRPSPTVATSAGPGGPRTGASASGATCKW